MAGDGQMKPWARLARRRGVVQFVSALLLNSAVTQHVTKGIPCPALNCYACPAASFACPIGTLQRAVGERRVPLYVLGAVALVGALIGRGACGWFCPFGWIQDLLFKLPVGKLRLRNRFTWTRYLVLALLVGLIPYLTAEPWFCKLCPAGTLEAGIPLAIASADIRALIGGFFWLKIGMLGLLLGAAATIRRPFCRWVCPLGALWAPLNRVSSIRLSVNADRCTRCDRCRQVCPVDVRAYEDADSAACVRCLACVEECPTEAISIAALHPPSRA
jgi:polyferredoxin